MDLSKPAEIFPAKFLKMIHVQTCEYQLCWIRQVFFLHQLYVLVTNRQKPKFCAIRVIKLNIIVLEYNNYCNLIN